MARELGVDINQVAGSGPERPHLGRRREGAREAAGRRRRAAAAPARGAAEPLPDFTRWGEIERQPMRAVRRKTAEHLSAAWATIPHVTQHDLADITGARGAAQEVREEVEAAGGNLTVTAIAVKVVAAALKVFPQFNASIDMAAERDHLQEVRQHRRRRRHRSRPARAGHPRRRHEEHHADCRSSCAAVREGAHPQDLARRDAGRLLQHLEPGRHRRHVVHADRQLAGSGDPRHLARAHGAGVQQGDRPVRAAADAAAVAVLRPPRRSTAPTASASCAGSSRRSSSRSCSRFRDDACCTSASHEAGRSLTTS